MKKQYLVYAILILFDAIAAGIMVFSPIPAELGSLP